MDNKPTGTQVYDDTYKAVAAHGFDNDMANYFANLSARIHDLEESVERVVKILEKMNDH